MGTDGTDRRLPVPRTPFGPLFPYVEHVHDLNLRGHSLEGLRAADAFDMIARVTGDEASRRHLVQARMYCNQALGRYEEALALGRRLRQLHAHAGDRVSEAKALADVAETLVRLSRLDEGLQHLAHALALLEPADQRHVRYLSACSSIAEAARAAELYELAESVARLGMRVTGEPNEALDLMVAELLIEWGLRLRHIGRVEDATHRYRQAVEITAAYVERLGADSPWATSLHALVLALLGDWVEAAAIAAALIVPARAQDMFHEARLSHLAHGIALRELGRLVPARREFIAAEELAVHAGQPTQRLIFQYELAVLAAAEVPGQASRELLAALRAQAEHLWQLRLERTAMLRQARRRIELEDARARADEAALLDPLTGLGNRRAFDRQMTAIDVAGAGGPLVLVLVDLDRFKTINDRYAHSTGDRVLRELATVLRGNCRTVDVPVRFGGDEFALFVRADLATAAQIAERIRDALALRSWGEIATGLRVTVSMGAAAYRAGMTSRQLFDAADRQLYTAKRSGRDRLAA
jgi:diguanylate cyclase